MRRLLTLMTLIAATCCAGCSRTPPATTGPPPSSIYPRTPQLKSFDLTDQLDQPFNSKSLQGQPWVASFFFMQCPSVCWRMNQVLAKWQSDHSDSPVKFVSITCDPQNDTPAALKLYADRLQADPKRWTFLTGDMTYISKVGADMFMLPVQQGTHSSKAIVVDRKGDIRGLFDVLDAAQSKKFESLLAEISAEE